MKISTALVALFVTAAMPQVASATTIDFTGQSFGVHAGALVYPEATFTSDTGTIYVGAAGIDHEICPLTASFNCEAGLGVVFTSAVNGLSFVTSGYDTATTSGVFVTGNSSAGAFNLTLAGSNGFVVDLSSYTGITNIFLTTDDPAGIAYDDFTFTGSVPEPATWGMMILGFGVIGGALRRRQPVKLSYSS